MTDTATPTKPVSEITKISNDITWIKAHILVALLAIALIAGSIIGGVALFQSLIEKHDARVAAAQLAKEGVDTATQAALVAELAKEHSDDVARDATQTALITNLIAQMAAERAATAKQVTTDATLNAQAAAARLLEQTHADASELTVNGDAVTMTLPMTRTVVADMDLYAQAQSDVTNLTGQLAAQTVLTTDANTELATANKVIAADKDELVQAVKADDAACNVRVDVEAAKGRKRTFWGTIGGVIAGLFLGGKI